MTCSSCGDTCSICGGNSSTCGCGTASGVAPYYNEACGVQESHAQVCVQNQFSYELTTGASFVIPGCGQTVKVIVPGLQSIVVGSYLWSPLYGYLTVVSVDYATSTIIVKNDCLEGSGHIGQNVLACSKFVVTDYPAGLDDPCASSAAAQGSLLICSGGATHVLDATAVGQVPVSVDAGTNEVQFQTIDITARTCTVLTADLNLVTGNVGPYTLTVDDTNIFVINDLIQIDSRTDRFLVDSIISPTQLTAIVAPAPAGMETISAGTEVCLAPCCEQLAFQEDNFRLSNQYDEGAGGPATVIPGASADSASADIVVENDSIHTMEVHVDVICQVAGTFANHAAATEVVMQLEEHFGYLIVPHGGAGVPATVATTWVRNYHYVAAPGALTLSQGYRHVCPKKYTVPPNSDLKLKAFSRCVAVAYTNVIQYLIGAGDLTVSIQTMKVAM